MTDNTKDVALVLSSGGPRGFAYMGAIEELCRRGYRITSVAGSSIGSLVGGIYAAGRLEEFKAWLFNLSNWQIMKLLDFSIGRNYLLKGDKIISAIKTVVPDVRIEELQIPFVAVATDLYTGEAFEFRSGPLFDAIRSSISIPSMFKPVDSGIHTFIDGGLVSTFPLSRVARSGHDILVGFDVNTTDAEGITEFLKNMRQHQEETDERRKAIAESIGNAGSLLEKVKAVSDEGRTLVHSLRERKKLQSSAPVEKDNDYVSLITRSFAIANHTIAKLETQMCPPDVLVTLSMDSYDSLSILDYTKGEEISDLGAKLMSEALDRYESEDSIRRSSSSTALS